jgi:PAS domain S-box-containing protein
VRSLLRVKQYYDAMVDELERLLVFKSALNSMDDCVIITNISGDIKFVNPAFEKKFGYVFSEIIGKHISIIKHDESTLALDKDSLIQDIKHEWKGNVLAVNKYKLRLNMSIKCSPIIKGNRHINLVFVLRESI